MKLVLELLTCGVRLCSEKKADLSEYELSLILLHFWGSSRNAGSQAELGFKNQNLIVLYCIELETSSARSHLASTSLLGTGMKWNEME